MTPRDRSAMELGIIIGDVPVAMAPQDHLRLVLAQVRAAVDAGVRCITIGQHFLYPDHRWLQPVPVLARLAAEVPEDVRLATTVLLAPLYRPELLAEELASLDVVTEGRLVVGVGLGYRTAEFDAFEVPFGERVVRLESCVAAMKHLWTLPHLRTWQQPHPPIWFGAEGPRGVRRAARLGDAWVVSPTMSVDRVADLWSSYLAERAETGRAASELPIRRDVSFGTDRTTALDRFIAHAGRRLDAYAANERDAATNDPIADRLIHGTVEQCAAQIDALSRRLPVTTLIVRPHWSDMTERELADYLAQLGELRSAIA